MTACYAIFHLNLAFSSIEEADRLKVIRNCYDSLLDLTGKHGLPIGIEMPAWTLQELNRLSPGWVERFIVLLNGQRCELIGSGYTQMIGPLAPDQVNRWNQRLGMATYEAILGVKPRLVLVNEMAFSASMVDHYLDVGYEGLVMDADNVKPALGRHAIGPERILYAKGRGQTKMPVLWSDSVLFQKLQRYVHGDIKLADYLDYFEKRRETTASPLPLYCSDAEIFNYRPGRYDYEKLSAVDGEWQRLRSLVDMLADQYGIHWLSPSAALAAREKAPHEREAMPLSSITYPIPVKKQPKYNVSRWAITGRDDLRRNTLCHRLHQTLAARGAVDEGAQRTLCELWSSDSRTHLTEKRAHRYWEQLGAFAKTLNCPMDYGAEPDEGITWTASKDVAVTPGWRVEWGPEGIDLSIHCGTVRAAFNLRRGLTLRSLAFAAHGYEPLIGTLDHGFFDDIALAADFYSGGVVMEIPSIHRRFTDLERVTPPFGFRGDALVVRGVVATTLGVITKDIEIDGEAGTVKLIYNFGKSTWPLGSFRVGNLTFIHPKLGQEALQLACANGGAEAEHFVVDAACDHGASISSIVSSTTGFGATDGRFELKLGAHRLELTWDPGQCAAFPMLINRPANPMPFTRLMFSLCELDETSKGDRVLPSFALKLQPGDG